MNSNRWIPILLIVAIFGAVLQIGTAVVRHNQTDEQFCKLDTAIVQLFQGELKGVTLAQAQKQPAAYERARLQLNGYIVEFAKLAPCHIDSTLPKDLLAGKPLSQPTNP